MTPEQEERLGRMMRQEAKKTGQVKKTPPDANRDGTITQDKIDADVCAQILQYLKTTDEQTHRIKIIQELNVGSGTIDRCLRKLAQTGKARRVQTRYSTHWEVVDWLTVPNSD